MVNWLQLGNRLERLYQLAEKKKWKILYDSKKGKNADTVQDGGDKIKGEQENWAVMEAAWSLKKVL